MTTTYTLHTAPGVTRHTDATTREDAILLAQDWIQDGDYPEHDLVLVTLECGDEHEVVEIRKGL